MPRCSAVESRGLPHAAWLRCRDGWQPCCGDAHAVGDERPLRVRKCRQLHRHVLQAQPSRHTHMNAYTRTRAHSRACACVRVCACMRARLCTSRLGHAALGALHRPPFAFRPSVPSAGAGPHLRRDCAWLTTPAPRATGEAGRRAFPNHGLSVRRRADAPTFRVLHRTASHRTRIASHATMPCVCACIRAFSRSRVRCADRAQLRAWAMTDPTDLGVRRGVHRPFLLVQNVPACPVGSSRQGPCPAWRVLVY
jgi:hypothetical protein